MDFTPDKDSGPTIDVPYFDEARSQDGWQGQGTTVSYDRLKSDVTNALARLGGVVGAIQRGAYQIGKVSRPGVQIQYSVEGPNNQMVYGRLDIAALPIKEPKRRANWQAVQRSREDAALRMALYNVVEALRAQWVLKQLNPGYIPLMPWLLAKGNATLSELYAASGFTKALMPPKPDKFTVEGEYRDIKE